ncbi:MAG TPA: ABC transporter ATP-binding protein [Thermomicrobiales bacterium]|nr:ABC transporter ATP-binding protein [Thermomicrobiales bacterium]
MSATTAVGTDVLRVEDLSVHYQTRRGPVKAVDRVSFGLRRGERLGLAGESGSGKSTTALAIMRLIHPPGRIVGGAIYLGERDLARLSEEAMRQVRLADIALIPQGAMNSLNPVRRVRDHFADSIRAHERNIGDDRLRERTRELLRMVELREEVARLYPHELSGGMKQRVCIALGISLQPQVIIADEPTSALDVVVQRQVMQTLGAVQQRLAASVILVGHDMGLLAQFVDRLAVMYAGRFVEVAPIREIFHHPLHAYTRALIESLPTFEERGVFRGIAGRAAARPNPSAIPDLLEVAPEHWVAPEVRNEK